MSTAIRFGERQLTTELISQHLLSSNLLPLVLREILVDEILADWQAERPEQLIYQPEEFAAGCDRLARADGYQGLSENQIEVIVDRSLKLQKFKQAGWGHRVNSYFLERKHDLDRIVYSILQVHDREVAQELFFRIQAGEGSFAELAFKYSQTDAAQDGGKVAPQFLDDIHPELDRFLNYLQPGELSPVFSLDGYYTFIRFEHLLPARLDDTMRSTLIDELFDRWVQERIAEQVGLIDANSQAIPPQFDRSSAAVRDDNSFDFNPESESTAIQVDAQKVEDNSSELISASLGSNNRFTQTSSSFYLPNENGTSGIEADRRMQASNYAQNLARQVKNIVVGTISIAVASSLFALSYQVFERKTPEPMLGLKSIDSSTLVEQNSHISKTTDRFKLGLNSQEPVAKIASHRLGTIAEISMVANKPLMPNPIESSPLVSISQPTKTKFNQ